MYNIIKQTNQKLVCRNSNGRTLGVNPLQYVRLLNPNKFLFRPINLQVRPNPLVGGGIGDSPKHPEYKVVLDQTKKHPSVVWKIHPEGSDATQGRRPRKPQ